MERNPILQACRIEAAVDNASIRRGRIYAGLWHAVVIARELSVVFLYLDVSEALFGQVIWLYVNSLNDIRTSLQTRYQAFLQASAFCRN